MPGASVGASCFGGARSLQTIILECKVDLEDLVKILQACKRLKRLECPKVDANHPGTKLWWHEIECPNLETILLRWGEGPDQIPMRDMYVCAIRFSFFSNKHLEAKLGLIAK